MQMIMLSSSRFPDLSLATKERLMLLGNKAIKRCNRSLILSLFHDPDHRKFMSEPQLMNLSNSKGRRAFNWPVNKMSVSVVHPLHCWDSHALIHDLCAKFTTECDDITNIAWIEIPVNSFVTTKIFQNHKQMKNKVSNISYSFFKKNIFCHSNY